MNIWKNNPISFVQALGLLFIGLKLTGYIDWHWWWVLSPIWLRYTGIILFWLIIDNMIKRWQLRTGQALRGIQRGE
jgi:hypothetical protein